MRVFRIALPLVIAVVVAATVGFRPRERAESKEEYRVRERFTASLFDPALAPTLLDDPKRDAWQKPQQIVDTLRLKPGETVADVGAGSGYLMRYLSRAVGPTGTVYAQEIQKGFLPELNRRAKPLKNVKVVLGTADDPRLPPGEIDCFVLLTTYHEVQNAVAFLKTLKQFAKPGARLAIIDFDESRRGNPPAPIEHQVEARDVLAEAHAAGWNLAEKHEFLSSQCFLIFTPAR